MVLDGKAVSQTVKEKITEKCSLYLKRFGRKPCLAVILVGNNPASLSYVAGKKKCCEILGIDHRDYYFDNNVKESKVLECITELNKDENVDGILVQLPLPENIDQFKITNAIDPQKDVDGFTSVNAGAVFLGAKGIQSCTPKGIMRIIDYYNIETQGKNICIIGRSNIVGKPLSALFMQKDRNATVTVCNSHTKNLNYFTKNADILISAVGIKDLVKADMVKEGAVVIDVGINRVPDSTKKTGYAIKGDVDFANVSKIASAITPVPGGIGPMTVAMLMENTLECACRLKNTEVFDL